MLCIWVLEIVRMCSEISVIIGKVWVVSCNEVVVSGCVVGSLNYG